jgi:hypothetical protein
MQDLAVWASAHTAYLVHPDFGVQGALLKLHDNIVPLGIDAGLMQSLRRRIFTALGAAIVAFLLFVLGPVGSIPSPFWPIIIFVFFLGIMLLKDIENQSAMMRGKTAPVLAYSPKIQLLFGAVMVLGSFIVLAVMPFLT